MNTQTILKTKNWTGMTMAELLDAGRIRSRVAVVGWVQWCINESHENLTLEAAQKIDLAKVKAEREEMIREICTMFDLP